MKEYILKGESAEVEKVLRENRIRVERGVITITPVQPETVPDSDSIKTLIESHRATEEACQRMAVAQIELAGLASELVAIIVTSGQTIPDELVAKLDSFGVDVPKMAETVPESTDTAENAGESVPETVPNDADPMKDDKNINVDDKTDVNLDDVKDTPGNDTKDVSSADTKEAAPTKAKRTKKAE